MLQILVLAALVAVPWFTQNPLEWSPSRIVLGQLPEPKVFPVTGDTWSLTVAGFTLTHPVAFVEEVISSKVLYVPFLVSVLIPLAITVVLGRVFCSWMCPVGFMLELNQNINKALKRAGMHFGLRIRDFRYTVFTLALLFGFLFAFPLISVFDPPHVFGRELIYAFTHKAVSLSGVGLLAGIFIFESVSTSRAWCNYVCPSGGGLSLIGSKRLLHIGMDAGKCIECEKCDEACPYYLAPMGLAKGERFDWEKCDNCGLCRDVCPARAITYKFDTERG